MNNYKVEGIIIKRRNFGEGDKIITLFTRECGKLDILAKGIRRISSRRGPSMELFNHVEVVLHRGKFLDIATEVMILHTFSGMRKQLPTIAKAYQVSELVQFLTRDHQETPEVFATVLTYFRELDEGRVVQPGDVQYQILSQLGFLAEEQHLHLELDEYIEQIAERRLLTKRLYEE